MPMGLSLSLILPPVLASIIGSFAVVRWQPPGQVVSGVQHFTAGVVLAALASELLPEVKKEGNWLWAGIGFVLGVALMLGLSQFSRSMEARYENAKSLRKAAILPIGLIVAVGVDLLVDGVLVGLGSTLSFSQGLVLAAALTLEILFVGVSLTLTLKAQGIRPLIAASATSALSLFTFVGALIALFLLAGAPVQVLAAVLAFGAAALLYLVVEELLVEAHEHRETALLTALFFVGFLCVYVFAALGE
ncbi:MAG: ZIP family metal transporter [Renibacterium sp.]|nr:ZIP family metal transporter [Renibacterium sp.]